MAELCPFHVWAGHTGSSLRRKVLLFLAKLRDSFLWVSSWEAGMERKTVCGCVWWLVWDNSTSLCLWERFFFFQKRVQSCNKGGWEQWVQVEKCWLYCGSWRGGGGGCDVVWGLFKLIWSGKPQRHGRCERATHPDRNLSRLHRCFVFQINWPL